VFARNLAAGKLLHLKRHYDAVVAGFIDHLWQSVGFFAATWLAMLSVRNHSARLRLWMWRIAALKFAVPFWLLFAWGAWLGFSVDQPSDLPPAVLIEAVRVTAPVVAPVTTAHASSPALAAALAAMLLAALASLKSIRSGIHLERWRAREETLRLERDPDDAEPNPGFLQSAFFTALCLSIIGFPVLAGAVDDRFQRHELLVMNSTTLRTARIAMSVAAPGMGQRSHLIARADGVLIRNTNIQGLVALAYGVSPYSVWLDQMFPEDASPEDKYWVSLPRYDVVVTAPIQVPDEFDPYALRQIVTKLLAERFGLEVYVKQKCQPPCGRYNVPLPEVE
jgi:hypothetical protein